MDVSAGTHEGKLDLDARNRRKMKNARNAARQHPKGSAHSLDMPVPGAHKVVTSRLYRDGNRQARGGR